MIEIDKEALEPDYPQAKEKDEFRYLAPEWLQAVAEGLTTSAEAHPGETWKTIPPREHAARAIRHLNYYRMGDRSENHLVNAAMRCMMAFITDLIEQRQKLFTDLLRF